MIRRGRSCANFIFVCNWLFIFIRLPQFYDIAAAASSLFVGMNARHRGCKRQRSVTAAVLDTVQVASRKGVFLLANPFESPIAKRRRRNTSQTLSSSSLSSCMGTDDGEGNGGVGHYNARSPARTPPRAATVGPVAVLPSGGGGTSNCGIGVRLNTLTFS